MEKPTSLESYLTGGKDYLYDGFVVKITPYFVYKVSVDEYWKGGYCSLGEAYYASETLLKFKQSTERIRNKNTGGFKEKTVTLVGVPKSFAEVRNLKEYIPKKEKSKKSGK